MYYIEYGNIYTLVYTLIDSIMVGYIALFHGYLPDYAHDVGGFYNKILEVLLLIVHNPIYGS
jgi:hypothetical protein